MIPIHLMDQIRADRLARDQRDEEKARRRREDEARPKQKQAMLLSHLDDCSGQGTLFEEEL